MSDANRLDPGKARSDHARNIIELRNAGASWKQTARIMGCSVRIAREAWARENAHQRGDHEQDTPTTTGREDATIGNEDLLRGIPVVGSVSGTIRGTAPGSPSWPLDREQRPPRSPRMAS